MANYPQLDDQVGVWKLKEVNNAVSGGYWRNAGTKGIYGGSYTGPAGGTVIDQIILATAGNATDFGDLSVGRGKSGGLGSFTRCIFVGGQTPSDSNVIDYINFASTGNAADFGNILAAGYGMG